MNILKKLWNGILNAIAWVTQDSHRLDKAKRKIDRKPDVFKHQIRFRLWR